MKILVAHDGSDYSNKALKKGANMAQRENASLLVVNAVPDLGFTDELGDDYTRTLYSTLTDEAEKLMKGIRDDLSKSVSDIRTVVKFGSPAEIIIDTAKNENVDLIVIGSHGKHGAKKFYLGSVSSKVVSHAPCDVLVVK
ncbi:MAG: universal stress protein [Nitrospirota bacterium]